MQEAVVRPIGTVHNEVKEIGRRAWEQVTSRIVIDESLEESLKGLEEFSHIVVVFWLHRATAGRRPGGKTHPQGRADLPSVGLFSTRSPYRPNPIGVTVSRLVERRGNVLVVTGLDAIDGTPVLDIKPHLPPREPLADFRMPDWAHKLR